MTVKFIIILRVESNKIKSITFYCLKDKVAWAGYFGHSDLFRTQNKSFQNH